MSLNDSYINWQAFKNKEYNFYKNEGFRYDFNLYMGDLNSCYIMYIIHKLSKSIMISYIITRFHSV